MPTFPPLVLPPDFWRLPNGWSWRITRVIHCLPDDTTEGWRVILSHKELDSVEVVHRDRDHARAIALEAAGELYPTIFVAWAVRKAVESNGK